MNPPPRRDSLALSLKINNDLMNHFKNCIKRNIIPKLVIKNGQILIKITEDLIFPCNQIPENLKFDIYANDERNNYKFEGTVNNRLNVLNDSKQAKNILKNLDNNQPISLPNSPLPLANQKSSLALDHNPYKINQNDSKLIILEKFLCLIALGPITIDKIYKILSTDDNLLKNLIDNYTQVYDPNDSFIIDDVFPNLEVNESIDKNQNSLILKDKAYKELKPWNWKWFNDFERNLIINNINNALTRLGFSDTHPLRRKITNPDLSNNLNPSKLGGGFLTSNKKFKKSLTDLPKLLPDNKILSTSKTTSPKKRTNSSDDEKKAKALKKNPEDGDKKKDNEKLLKNPEIENGKSPRKLDTNNDARKDDKPIEKKLKYYNDLAIKFKEKYNDYEKLYTYLKNNKKSDQKKQLIKLFELHLKLSEWKRKLWDYNNEYKLKENIMTLSKHKKTKNQTTSIPKNDKLQKISLDY